MTAVDEIASYIESLGDVLVLAPQEGDGTPELAWGDRFFYFAPDGVLPPGQPFATIITKDYPGEPVSNLGDGVYRVNIDAGRRDQPPTGDPTRRDEVLPHPVYGQLGWVCVVQPGPQTEAALRRLLTTAHANAARRWRRRHEGAQ